ncbi:MAG: hypothetical protein N4A70_19660 [Pelagimonas sp.]|jgi:hypothetical protein|nr:hypothetical protein [Pelagimonas sp.]
MRGAVFAGLLLSLATPVMADEEKVDCDAQAAMVMEVVQARADGKSKRKASRVLKKELGKDAAGMLADWVYTLPEDQLNEQVGVSWKALCETL